MQLYLIRRKNGWADPQALQAAAELSAHVGNSEMPDRVRWIRSYVVNEAGGGLGTLCVYEARDEESLREHARRVGMPTNDISLVADTVIVRSDPLKATATA